MSRLRFGMLDRARAIDAVRDASDLTPTEKLTAVMLISRSDDSGSAWPSWARLARDTGLSRTTCRKAVAGLVATRYVRVERRPGLDGDRDQTNLFRLTPLMGSPAAPMGSPTDPIESEGKGHPEALMGSPAGGRGVATRPPWGQQLEGVGSAADPEPSPLSVPSLQPNEHNPGSSADERSMSEPENGLLSVLKKQVARMVEVESRKGKAS